MSFLYNENQFNESYEDEEKEKQWASLSFFLILMDLFFLLLRSISVTITLSPEILKKL